MKRLVSFGVAFTFCASTVFAAGPLETSAIAAAQQVKDGPKPTLERKNPDEYWTGVGLMGVGGFMIGWGLGQSDTVTCGGGVYLFTCTETGAHKGLYIGAGAGILGAGAALAVMGGKRVAVSPARGGVMLSTTARF